MKRVENPQLTKDILTRLGELYIDRGRHEGIHLTDLIYCLTKSYHDRTDPLPPTDRELMLFSVGLSLQMVLIPPEQNAMVLERDGILCSPDFISIGGRLSELKTTRTSMMEKNKDTGVRGYKDLPQTWYEQIMGYSYAAGLQEYELAVLHLMGDYAPPFPTLMGWRLSFDREELEKYWLYIKGRKLVLEATIEVHIPPKPFQWCKEWECDGCRYKLRCDVVSQG